MIRPSAVTRPVGLFCLIILFAFSPLRCLGSAQEQELSADQPAARAKLADGVEAYRRAQFDEAVEDFKQATELDPLLLNARLYLATAYASQYIPGAHSDENLALGKQAIQEFQIVLDRDPKNLAAIDGIASILYNMGSSPYDPEKLKESRKYHLRHTEIRPDDPEPYFWLGVIDWSIARHAEETKRAELAEQTGQQLDAEQPLPYPERDQLRAETQEAVDDGIKNLKKAVDLRPDYDDAIAYLNLIYRCKAAIEPEEYERQEDIKAADELVAKVMAIKKARMSEKPQ